MGTLQYPSREIEIDDRALAHLQVVINTKFRYKQSFFFSWNERTRSSDTRTAVWLNAAIPLVFVYDSAARVPVNRAWLDQLLDQANSAVGLVFVPEPARPVGDPASGSVLAGSGTVSPAPLSRAPRETKKPVQRSR